MSIKSPLPCGGNRLAKKKKCSIQLVEYNFVGSFLQILVNFKAEFSVIFLFAPSCSLLKATSEILVFIPQFPVCHWIVAPHASVTCTLSNLFPFFALLAPPKVGAQLKIPKHPIFYLQSIFHCFHC